MPADVDTQFAEFARTGDPAPLGRVFDALAPDLVVIAAHLRGASEAEDIVQTTFLRAIMLRERFEIGRSVRPWLLGILGRVAQEARASARRRSRLDAPRTQTANRPARGRRGPGSRPSIEATSDPCPPRSCRPAKARRTAAPAIWPMNAGAIKSGEGDRT